MVSPCSPTWLARPVACSRIASRVSSPLLTPRS
jgi:hypothetical protein